MKQLLSIESFGARQGKSTNWQRWPGYSVATLDDGSTLTIPENAPSFFEWLVARGVSCEHYKERLKLNELLNGYPSKPLGAVHKWEWSTTFGRWSALVTFANGWHGYTYAKPFNTEGELIER